MQGRAVSEDRAVGRPYTALLAFTLDTSNLICGITLVAHSMKQLLCQLRMGRIRVFSRTQPAVRQDC